MVTLLHYKLLSQHNSNVRGRSGWFISCLDIPTGKKKHSELEQAYLKRLIECSLEPRPFTYIFCGHGFFHSYESICVVGLRWVYCSCMWVHMQFCPAKYTRVECMVCELSSHMVTVTWLMVIYVVHPHVLSLHYAANILCFPLFSLFSAPTSIHIRVVVMQSNCEVQSV